jgi:crotonobetainyl-CoA:carnitine CoA-transferase CaiB-like acyl-CoA transferase
MKHNDSLAPLAGIRVVETTSYLAGPMTSMMLADLGAEVVKVEPPGGDGFRGFGHRRQGLSALWSSVNRGRRSIVLNLKDADDLTVMKGLLAEADVLVANWRPHVATQLGLGSDVLDDLNPRLVRLSINGFGASGPMAGAPAFDSLIQGLTGMVDLLRHTGRPDVSPYWVVDKVVAAFGAQALLAALLRRERTGRGGSVEVPMLDVMTYFNFPDLFQHRTYIGDASPWRPAFSPVVPTADGYIVITPVSGAHISRMLKALERPDIKSELQSIQDPSAAVDVLYGHLRRILPAQTTEHWLRLFQAQDVPVGPMLSLEEHLADPQVVHNNLYHEVGTPVGPARAVRYPACFDGEQLRARRPAPNVDEHAAEIRMVLSPGGAEAS